MMLGHADGEPARERRAEMTEPQSQIRGGMLPPGSEEKNRENTKVATT